MSQTVKNLPAVQETQVRSLAQEDPLEKRMATHSSILPGEFHGQRSLVGHSPWDCQESDMTERLTFSLSPSIGVSGVRNLGAAWPGGSDS